MIKQRSLTGDTFHPNPLLDRIYRGRGVTSMGEIDYSMSGMLPPEMKDINKACDLLEQAILNNHNILIIGDYDCDGATASSIAVEGLTLLGSKNVSFMVPDRMKLGYGLAPPIVHLAAKRNPDLIVTVDNGISAIDGALAVKKLVSSRTGKEGDVKLLITDHHLAPEILPEADAIVNPNQKDCPFPSKCIAGCGVMFYVLIALKKQMKEKGVFEQLNIPEPDLRELLDLLALGTVADVVALDKNNRIFVYQGLQRIKKGLVRPGIRHLLEIGKGDINSIKSMDFGFSIGPKINSAGRLDDMTFGITCLLEKDFDEARKKALALDELNKQRKEIQSEMLESASDMLKKANFGIDSSALTICVYDKDFHEGVIGLVASRLKEDYSRPVIVFTDTETNKDQIKGSGRSIPEIHLRDIIEEVSTLTNSVAKFGGHAMAAGLNIKKADFEKFKACFEDCVSKKISTINEFIETDGELLPEQMNVETCRILDNAGPWGQMFPEPVFNGKFVVLFSKPLKSDHLKLKISPVGYIGMSIDAIFFNYFDGRNSDVAVGDIVNIAYSPSINKYNGNETFQVMIRKLVVDKT